MMKSLFSCVRAAEIGRIKKGKNSHLIETKVNSIKTATVFDDDTSPEDSDIRPDAANDLDHIFDNLYIGGKRAATDSSRLHELGIKRILNVTCQIENLFPEEFTYKRIVINDLV
jgi:hypothetical protein